MMEQIRLKVGCTKFPNISEGQIGFSEKSQSTCLKPNYSYVNGGATGFIHARNHVELLALTEQIGAMSKVQFITHYNIKPSDSWKNNYIHYLDKKIANALVAKGIQLTINGQVVEFYTEPGYYEYTKIKPTKKFKEMLAQA